MPQGLVSLLWFCAILALIPATLWLLKRTPIGAASSAPGLLRTVATLPLSASQRIVAVEIGSGDHRRWLVLGVTPSAIHALHDMAPVEIAPAATAAALGPTFQGLLGRFRAASAAGGDGGRDAR